MSDVVIVFIMVEYLTYIVLNVLHFLLIFEMTSRSNKKSILGVTDRHVCYYGNKHVDSIMQLE